MHSPMKRVALFSVAAMLAFALASLVWSIGPGASQAEDATMPNCPQPSKWAIAVWGGDDATDAGEALAPIVVRELAAGKGFLFSDRGDVPLRGFEDPVRLLEVRWRAHEASA